MDRNDKVIEAIIATYKEHKAQFNADAETLKQRIHADLAEAMAEPESYACAHCGERFTKSEDWEPRAQEEARALWGKPASDPGMAVICEDCFREFMAWMARRKSEGGTE
jgi:hypothetical protein